MNLNKSYEFFQPEMCKERLHIIGCGAVGSTLAENLVRLGITNITLYDFDTVESHNIANQMFRETDIGKLKTEALRDILLEINPDLDSGLKLCNEGWTDQRLTGYVFLCVDSIELRRKIAEQYKASAHIKAMFDFRIRLEDAQHYAADWSNAEMVRDFIGSMNFTHEEAAEETPRSACNLELSINPTVRTICAYGVSNFIKFVKDRVIKKFVLVDPFQFEILAF